MVNELLSIASYRAAGYVVAAGAVNRTVQGCFIDDGRIVLTLDDGPMGVTEAAIVRLAGELSVRVFLPSNEALDQTESGKTCIAAHEHFAGTEYANNPWLREWFTRCEREAAQAIEDNPETLRRIARLLARGDTLDGAAIAAAQE